MAVNKIYKFRRIDDLQYFLNGAITGGMLNKAQGGGTQANLGPGVNGLVGKTLIFTAPTSATVTFVTADGAGGSAAPPGTNPDKYTLLFKDIKAQIEAAVAGALVLLDSEQKLLIVESAPSGGVSLTKDGTANTLLGFDTAVATTGLVYKPVEVSNTPPCWVWAYNGNDNMHNVFVWA